MNTAVINYVVNPIAFVKMDDAWLGSIDIAHKKSEQQDNSIDSGDIGKLSKSVRPLPNI